MTEQEIAWAAGLFDGEGTATRCRNRPRLAVKMADEESVRRFAAAVGVGTVYGPYEHRAATLHDGHVRKPSYLWVAEAADFLHAAALLLPHVGTEKRESILAQRDHFYVKTAVLT